jgi:hypothetical protein
MPAAKVSAISSRRSAGVMSSGWRAFDRDADRSSDIRSGTCEVATSSYYSRSRWIIPITHRAKITVDYAAQRVAGALPFSLGRLGPINQPASGFHGKKPEEVCEYQLPEDRRSAADVRAARAACDATARLRFGRFAGPEERYPEGLTADLHRIAELADQNGLRLLLERAAALKKELIPKQEAEGQHLNPKHVALRTFLQHRDVFEAASDFLAIETRTSLTEFSGPEENVHPEINDQVRKDFEREAGQLLVRDLLSSYCRIGWYEDEDELNVVVTHGEAVVITQRVKDGVEEPLTYRPVGHANLAYDAVEGRLKVGGIAKALRPKLAEVFAAMVLRRPGFFRGTAVRTSTRWSRSSGKASAL